MTSVTEAIPLRLSLSPSNVMSLSISPAQLSSSPSHAQPPSSQVPDVPLPLVIDQMILKHGVDEVKFLLAMEEKILIMDTSSQVSFSNLAKNMA